MTDDVKNEDLKLPTYKDELIKVGVDGAYIAEKHREALEAMETKAQIPKGKDYFIYSDPLIAWDTRLKALIEVNKIRGDYQPRN